MYKGENKNSQIFSKQQLVVKTNTLSHYLSFLQTTSLLTCFFTF